MLHLWEDLCSKCEKAKQDAFLLGERLGPPCSNQDRVQQPLLFLLDDEGWPTLPVAEVLVESQAEAPFEPRMSSSICSLIIPVGATPTSLGETSNSFIDQQRQWRQKRGANNQ